MMMSNLEYTQIKDLKVGMKNINAVFIVLEVGPPTLTKEAREVRTMRVADSSASVNLSVWDAPGALLQPGDIVRLLRGYTALWHFALTLYSGKNGEIMKVPTTQFKHKLVVTPNGDLANTHDINR
ncbi:Solute carrier family 35 member C2 [Operophtera brumata]|uniref:Solute carrier family 35 member C2 n=1 Tax=Operophtera brumata TaxID=104452 RepID=A0A0L7KX27_OPEBR|nr:Solute carrier family 35 member C2 [Operophtera brumata]